MVSETQTPKTATPFEGHFVFLCVALLFVSLLSSANEVIQLFSGTAITTVKVTSGLRLFREGVYLVILLDFLLLLLSAQRHPFLSRGSVLIAMGALLWACICIYYSLALGLAVPVVVSGLRFLEYVPLGLVAGEIYRLGGARPFARIAKAVFWFVLIETVIGGLETRLPIPYWGTTFIGSRAFGTFTSPNIFGPTMVFCYLFIRAVLSARWHRPALVLTVFDVFASGSRAAVLGLIAVLGIYWVSGLRNIWTRAAVILGGVAMAPVILLLVTNPAITGRDTRIGAGGFERLDVWSNILSKLNSATDIIFGWGTGLGSNTVFALYGYDLPGAYISDNTFFFLIGSFGIVGVLFLAAVLGVVAIKLRHDPAGLAGVLTLGLLMLISQALEVYPVNVLAMLLIGWRLKACNRVRSRHSPIGSARLLEPRGRLSPQL